MLHAMLCAVCCHELSSYRYADVMTHFECFGEFASFRLKTYITVNYFSKGQKAKRSHILSRDFPKGHLFCSTTQYSRYFQGHLFCCLRYSESADTDFEHFINSERHSLGDDQIVTYHSFFDSYTLLNYSELEVPWKDIRGGAL